MNWILNVIVERKSTVLKIDETNVIKWDAKITFIMYLSQLLYVQTII